MQGEAGTVRALPLLNPLIRSLSERMIVQVRHEFPGWDVYALKADFDEWLDADASREPKDYEAAFYGFVKNHHQRSHAKVASCS